MKTWPLTFIRRVSDALETTGLPPNRLVLEITESGLMRDPRAVLGRLQALRELGVRLAIDDFGTGYSSLAYLRRFPFETLKIDRSFVAGLGRDREDEAIIEMIVALGHTLNLRTIAEGVETPAQLAQLRRLGCDAVQGYHLGRPAPPEHAWTPVTLQRPA